MQEIWTVFNKAADFNTLAKQLKVDPVLVRILRNRDLTTYEEMAQYLGKTDFSGYDGMLLKGMAEAVPLLLDKLKAGRHIRIISDYDVDGIVSNYILYQGFTRLGRELLPEGSNIDYVIPHRMKDGYGLNVRLIEEAVEQGMDTIVTCDNGIAAIEEIAYAKKKGLTVVVTDHHEVQEQLPDADSIINPKQKDCRYPFAQICGAVVAYKLIEQLYRQCGVKEEELVPFYPYIAMATVCDVMELRDENRFIVRRGLSYMRQAFRDGKLEPGLSALMEANKLDADKLTAYSFGFVLGPCLNAMGRLSTAVWGLKLLLETSKDKAAWRAMRLTQMNEIRKTMTKQNQRMACELAEQEVYSNDRVLVLYLKECHESIAGIVAGRVREHTGKPVLILTDSKEKGILKGSGRSIPEYDMFAALSAHKELFVKFGGHRMAAGLSIEAQKLQTLCQCLNQDCTLSDKDIARKRHIDMRMPVSYITESLVLDLSLMEPTGNGNERPLFAVKGMILNRLWIVGQNKNVLKMKFLDGQGAGVSGVFFGEQPLALFEEFPDECYACIEAAAERGELVNIAMSLLYQPTINEYNGVKSIELKILAVKYEE